MLKKNQVFVRAKSPSGKWINADILDLTDASFKTFVIDALLRGGHLIGLRPETVPGEEIELEAKTEETPDTEEGGEEKI